MSQQEETSVSLCEERKLVRFIFRSDIQSLPKGGKGDGMAFRTLNGVANSLLDYSCENLIVYKH